MMSKQGFEERLARLQVEGGQGQGPRRYNFEADNQRRREQERRNGHLHQDDEDESDAVFWTFYGLSAILISAAYIKFPEFQPLIVSYGAPVFAIVGCAKLYLTIRRRGVSFRRDGDNMLDIADTVSSLFKLFK